MGKFGLLFGLAAAGAAGEYGIARYFFLQDGHARQCKA